METEFLSQLFLSFLSRKGMSNFPNVKSLNMLKLIIYISKTVIQYGGIHAVKINQLCLNARWWDVVTKVLHQQLLFTLLYTTVYSSAHPVQESRHPCTTEPAFKMQQGLRFQYRQLRSLETIMCRGCAGKLFRIKKRSLIFSCTSALQL